MAAFDLNAQFENISEKANAASERIQLAADETRDRLAADAAIAQDKASEAADRLKNKAKTEARHDIRALARNSGPVALAGSAADCATVRRSTTDLPEAPAPGLFPPTTPGAPGCARPTSKSPAPHRTIEVSYPETGPTRRLDSRRDRRSPTQCLCLRAGERLMTQSDPSSRSLRREATSQLAGATAAVARRVVGAAVKGVIGGIQGAANGIRDGWSTGSQSRRPRR